MDEGLFSRVGRFAVRRRWYVVGAWAILALVAGSFARGLQGRLGQGGFDVPGSDSLTVYHQLQSAFGAPEAGGRHERAQALAQGCGDSGHVGISPAVSEYPATLRPNGAAAQAGGSQYRGRQLLSNTAKSRRVALTIP